MFNPMKVFYEKLQNEKLALMYNQKLLLNQINALESAIDKNEDFDVIYWLKTAKARSEGELEKIEKKWNEVNDLTEIIKNPFGIGA